MPSLILQDQCARCPRKVEEVVTVEEAAKRLKSAEQQKPDLQVYVQGAEVVTFNKLCAECMETVAKAIGTAGKALEHKSPNVETGRQRKRSGGKKEG